MPQFDSNDPRQFGWAFPVADIVPFVYRGHNFYQGVCERLVPVFTRALDLICAQPGFKLHEGSGAGDGMWGYEVRPVTGGGSMSFHGFGAALDINAPWNGYGVAVPPAGPYRMPLNTSDLVMPLGLLWGGSARWGSHRDWMHIENHNSPSELGGRPSPPASSSGYPLSVGQWFGQASTGAKAVSTGGAGTANLQNVKKIQLRVSVAPDGIYGPQTAGAVRHWQVGHGLTPDGLCGPLTWASLFGK